MSQRILAQLVVFPGVRERAAREVVEGKKEVVVFGGGGGTLKKISLPFFFSFNSSLSLVFELASMNALTLRSPGLTALRCVSNSSRERFCIARTLR